jgi:ankyrin repeat protein
VRLAESLARAPVEAGEARETSAEDVLCEYRDAHGRTVAHFAANFGQEGVLSALRAAAPVALGLEDNEGATPLHLAALGNRASTVEWLVRAGGQAVDRARADGDTALHLASRLGHASVVRALLALGADVRLCGVMGSAVHAAAMAGELEVLQCLASGEEGAAAALLDAPTAEHGMTPVLMAAAGHKVGVVEWLVERGPDAVDLARRGVMGLTVLHWACDAGLESVVQCVLRNRSPEAVRGLCAIRNDDACLPIQLAAGNGHADVARLLFDLSRPALPADIHALQDLLRVEAERAARERAAAPPAPEEPEHQRAAADAPAPPPASPADRERARAAKERGAALVRDGRWDLAEAAYDESLAADPRDETVLANRSFVRLRRGNAEGARADAAAALRCKPDWAKAHWRLAAALEALGRFEDAANEYWQALRRDQGNAALAHALRNAVHLARQEAAARAHVK